MKYKNFETLRKGFEFKEVYNEKKSVANRFFIMYFKKNSKDKLRLGISVSKKVGNSVTRHRISRYIREVVRLKCSDIKDEDIIFVVRQTACDINYFATEKSIVGLTKKAGLL